MSLARKFTWRVDAVVAADNDAEEDASPQSAPPSLQRQPGRSSADDSVNNNNDDDDATSRSISWAQQGSGLGDDDDDGNDGIEASVHERYGAATSEEAANFWRLRGDDDDAAPKRARRHDGNDAANDDGLDASVHRLFSVPADECAICWEQQNFLMRDTRPAVRGGGSGADADVTQAKTAMLRKIDDYRKVVYDLERSLRIVQNDRIVFASILMARHEFMERHLDAYRVPHTKWTMPLLEWHYDVASRHTFDLERNYRADELTMYRLQQHIVQHTLYIQPPPPPPNPDDEDPASGSQAGTRPRAGGPGAARPRGVNLGAADMVLKLSKRRQELNKAIDELVKGRAEDTQAGSRQLIALLLQTTGRDAPALRTLMPAIAAAGGGGDEDERPQDVVADMYNVGDL